MRGITTIIGVLLVISSLSGCTQVLGGCGEGYEEMYGGYDYVYESTTVNSDNSLSVTVKALAGAGFIAENEQMEAAQEIYVTLYVKMADGDEIQIGQGGSIWDIDGDSNDGTYWGTFLYYQGPAGFCDNGCEEVMFSAVYENGAMYYDGTCDSSPWIDI